MPLRGRRSSQWERVRKAYLVIYLKGASNDSGSQEDLTAYLVSEDPWRGLPKTVQQSDGSPFSRFPTALLLTPPQWTEY